MIRSQILVAKRPLKDEGSRFSTFDPTARNTFTFQILESQVKNLIDLNNPVLTFL